MKYLIFLSVLFFVWTVDGQAPSTFNYQAVVRNSDGEIQRNVYKDFKIEILQNGVLVFSEEHLDINTGDLGVINFKIGTGENQVNIIEDIDWSGTAYVLKISLDNEVMGESEILSVPVASGLTPQYILRLKSDPNAKDPNDIFFIDGAQSESDGINHYSFTHRRGGDVVENRKNLWMYGVRNRFMDVSIDGKLSIGQLSAGGQSQPSALDIKGRANSRMIDLRSFAGQFDTWISSYDENNNRLWVLNMSDRSQNNRFGLYSQIADRYQFWIDHSGMTNVRTLQIHGGADGAEYFDVSDYHAPQPGDLMIIDSKNEGKLKRSAEAYDSRIAGIVSGAGGINPGLVLEQEGELEGELLISLWGRVYMKATTENGKIKPGDLLTSSNLEGHAMKATKRKKSRGAIIGKALSSLDEGEGLVLILIQPQ